MSNKAIIEAAAKRFIDVLVAETAKPVKSREATRIFVIECWDLGGDDIDMDVAQYILDNSDLLRKVQAFDKSRDLVDRPQHEFESIFVGLQETAAGNF